MTLRVLHVSAVDFTAAKLLAPQLEVLAESGYEVRVACQKTDPAHWESLERFRPMDIPFPRSLRPFAMLSAARALSHYVREWRPDILHLHTPAASIPVRLLPSTMWADASIFYTVHGFLHMWPPRGFREKLVQRFEQFEARRTSVMLFQSEEDFRAAQERRYRSNLIFLGNGVEDSWFVSPVRRRRSVLQLLYVGRLVREKGIIELLDAVSQVEGIHLHIAGAALNSDRDAVSEEVAHRASSESLRGRVTLYGMLARNSLQKLLVDMDVLCLPSYREGVPRSVIEALAAGRPVLATDIRGNRELIKEGVNGFLVPPRDAVALAEGLTQFRDLDADALASMGARARASVDPARRESAVYERLLRAYAAGGLSSRAHQP